MWAPVGSGRAPEPCRSHSEGAQTKPRPFQARSRGSQVQPRPSHIDLGAFLRHLDPVRVRLEGPRASLTTVQVPPAADQELLVPRRAALTAARETSTAAPARQGSGRGSLASLRGPVTAVSGR